MDAAVLTEVDGDSALGGEKRTAPWTFLGGEDVLC